MSRPYVYVRASLATNSVTDPVQTLPSRTSCNRRSIPTLYLGAGDPCRRYPGPCIAALGGRGTSFQSISSQPETLDCSRSSSRLSYSVLHTRILLASELLCIIGLLCFACN